MFSTKLAKTYTKIKNSITLCESVYKQLQKKNTDELKTLDSVWEIYLKAVFNLYELNSGLIYLSHKHIKGLVS